ncbi:DUF7065 domain-containing protein [Mycolicibacterium thermoresistibile]|uniref:AttH domain-containing protein n=2 Tax=Mycolicibacterium thermoresistibile TaxID=1797 RepID=G7CEP9_MYCT3|nr:hypothetical protein [Mycolicibacterium thermoresistibile]EHI13541.1 hypothetical protein KEK_07327 [Mycolicibacterium thermoresistibile ATCC 19527]MCV7190391.1 hypothetical protein [Mycolicibacterium thermoresistibile]GAT15835.1 putative uncharacterized protein [Mycolicibacterium thermoresistibile]SNW19498.1 aminoglycoside phosphotransferase [Mycolicibacterium thermoresistibile]
MKLRKVDPADDGSHQPTGDDERWQESWVLYWFDPSNMSGGSHHFGLQRPRERADVWDWVTVQGRHAGHFNALTLPIPDQDLSKFEIGRMRIQTLEPLQKYRFSSEYPSTGTKVDIVYEAFTDAISVALDGSGAEVGANHYETFGRASGTVTQGGQTLEVSGWAFQDHSWGIRDWNTVGAHRWICATFSENFYCAAGTFATNAGVRAFGYVFDGEFKEVTRMSFGGRVGDDGFSVEGCDARIWTKPGDAYHITGDCVSSQLSNHHDGWFTSNGFAMFECGGRLGTGVLELAELKQLTPSLQRRLDEANG